MRLVPPVFTLADHQVFRLLTMRAPQKDQVYIDERAVSDHAEHDEQPCDERCLYSSASYLNVAYSLTVELT